MPKRWIRAQDIHFAEVDDEFFLTLERKPVVACLNKSAFAVLENLDGFTDTDHISKLLAEHTKTKPPEMRRAVDRMCKELLELEAIHEIESDAAGQKPVLAMLNRASGVPQVIRVWRDRELANGGVLVNSADGDIRVIVPNVTDGPIKTCPPHTCTIPAGLFTARTIIRVFDPVWQKNFAAFRRAGFAHLADSTAVRGR